LIGDDGQQLGVLPMSEALAKAQERETDLVEVSPNAEPPVCRLMDYGKFKYRQNKRHHQGQKQHATQIKEVRLRPRIEDHDLEIKINRARKFIDRNDKVLVSLMFRGRERAHEELGVAVMERFVAALEEVAKPEGHMNRQGYRITMLLAPKK